jgi:methyltransferase-like protein 6
VATSQQKLSLQGDSVGDFWRTKYINETGRYWHEFYKRNKDHFYKDRHYLHVVFPELGNNSDEDILLAEVGCGVGNAVFPLLQLNNRLRVIAVDHAKSAIEILRYKRPS